MIVPIYNNCSFVVAVSLWGCRRLTMKLWFLVLLLGNVNDTLYSTVRRVIVVGFHVDVVVVIVTVVVFISSDSGG